MVVAYEDVPSRDSAIRLCDRVFGKLRGEVDFQADWWAFKYLGTAQLGEQAAGEAANSDLLIVSADDRGDFPLDIKYWFEGWLSKLAKRGPHESALVSLVLPLAATEQASAKERYLRGLAQRANLDYLPMGGSRSETTDAALETASEVSFAALQDAAEHRYHIPDWGINE